MCKDFEIGIDLEFHPGDNAQQTQRRRCSEPIIVRLVAFDRHNFTISIDDIQGEHAGRNSGVLPDRGAMAAHRHRPCHGDVPVHQRIPHGGVPRMQPLGELEERDAGLDDDGSRVGALFEDHTGYPVHLFRADDDGVGVVRAHRVVPHVPLSGSAHRGPTLRRFADEGDHLVYARRVVDGGDIVARREALAVERIVGECEGDGQSRTSEE